MHVAVAGRARAPRRRSRALAVADDQGDDRGRGARARPQLRAGKVALVVVPGEPRTYRYDETRPEARLARLLVDDRLQRAEGRADPTRVADEHVTEPGARYIDFLVPGLVGLTLMSSSMWGIGYVIVEMRTKKLVKRMLATPMRRGDFLLSFVVMRALFVLVEVPVLFAFGWIAFGVRVTGSPVLAARRLAPRRARRSRGSGCSSRRARRTRRRWAG